MDLHAQACGTMRLDGFTEVQGAGAAHATLALGRTLGRR
jgi:hypothetical protein